MEMAGKINKKIKNRFLPNWDGVDNNYTKVVCRSRFLYGKMWMTFIFWVISNGLEYKNLFRFLSCCK